MRITEPILIRKTKKRGYTITGQVPDYGKVRRYGKTEEEVKERFFVACERVACGQSVRVAA